MEQALPVRRRFLVPLEALPKREQPTRAGQKVTVEFPAWLAVIAVLLLVIWWSREYQVSSVP